MSSAPSSRSDSIRARFLAKGREPFSSYLDSKLPNLHWPLKITGAILIVALLFDGRPVLAALYLVPPRLW